MKARWKWFLKKKINSRDNYLCVIITLSPKQDLKKKNLMGKLNEKNKTTKNGGVKMLMTKRHIQTRSSDQHRLLLLTEVKTKEYRHSECMEKYKLH